MTLCKGIFFFLRDCVEKYIPIGTFCIMFTVFIFQVFCRYVLKSPITWAYEITVSCYLWTVVLGACYTQRCRSHVSFTLVYDKLGVKGKAVCAFLGDALIAFAFGVLIVPTCKFVSQIRIQETSILKIGLDIVYAPIAVFVVIIFIYMLIDMYHCFMVFTGLGGNAAVARMLAENRNEVEETIEASEKNYNEIDKRSREVAE